MGTGERQVDRRTDRQTEKRSKSKREDHVGTFKGCACGIRMVERHLAAGDDVTK